MVAFYWLLSRFSLELFYTTASLFRMNCLLLPAMFCCDFSTYPLGAFWRTCPCDRSSENPAHSKHTLLFHLSLCCLVVCLSIFLYLSVFSFFIVQVLIDGFCQNVIESAYAKVTQIDPVCLPHESSLASSIFDCNGSDSVPAFHLDSFNFMLLFLLVFGCLFSLVLRCFLTELVFLDWPAVSIYCALLHDEAYDSKLSTAKPAVLSTIVIASRQQSQFSLHDSSRLRAYYLTMIVLTLIIVGFAFALCFTASWDLAAL